MAENTFHIGLCMAGAVSAGAYTAGVVNYLLTALDRWEQCRGQAGVPTHRVQLSIIGGASAGGMTGFLTAAAINQRSKNLFHKSWVTMQGNNMMGPLLDCSDLKQPGLFRSFLNGNFANELAEEAFSYSPSYWNETPAYIHPQLKVFATLTNLQGFTYPISFNTDLKKKDHTMSVHYDYACFQLANPYQHGNGWMPVNLRTGLNANTFRDAALATGAFPLGLPARTLKRPLYAIQENKWINQAGLTFDPTGSSYQSFHVDGGLMNNEPFEKVRELLNDLVFTETKQLEDVNDFGQFRSTVLMVDPFPGNLAAPFNQHQSVVDVAKHTLYAMMQQMKAKPAPIADMLSKNKAGQFLIAPVRYTADQSITRIEGAKAIACGAINGFGGFISQDFREHDYALGQYNCEQFLRNHFTIPIEQFNSHPIFSKGYEGIDISPYQSARSSSVQVIPIFKSEQKACTWPMLNQDPIINQTHAIRKRVAALSKSIPLKGVYKPLFYIGGQLFLNRWITQKTHQLILEQLREHELMK
ncbi:patatin-like phospholipase family protein [Sediminibacterium sp.]|uniref:patatin-like phospholipase family protein n=1 Tax=Sediminibacterium sp. TaxID=1917865 RepID=UPI00271C6DBA|nr:patatin-like phospholipase family protein [Sediminibacterium sp.]MDO9157434.1 patatin-like phospholipase family protein [Sediminibacterium sp.]MDP2422657.1 patatin-like phospholipase family protein [Sediminibacterium sp.]